MRFEWKSEGAIWIVRPILNEETEWHRFYLIKAEIAREVAAGRFYILVDAGGIDFVDSTGIGALAGSARLIKEKDGLLCLADPVDEFLLTLSRTGLDKVIPYRWGLDDCLKEMTLVLRNSRRMDRMAGGNRPREVEHLEKHARKIEAQGRARRRAAQTSSQSRTVPMLTIDAQGPEGSHDWQKALGVYSEASRLARKYGHSLHPTTSFQDFLSFIAKSARQDRDT